MKRMNELTMNEVFAFYAHAAIEMGFPAPLVAAIEASVDDNTTLKAEVKRNELAVMCEGIAE